MMSLEQTPLSDSDQRFKMVFLAFMVMGLAIIIRIVTIQYNQKAPNLVNRADAYAWRQEIIRPNRGEIFDREGHLLAGNQVVYEIRVQLNLAKGNYENIAWVMENNLSGNFAELLNNVSEKQQDLVLADYVPPEKARKIFDMAYKIAEAQGSERKSEGIKLSKEEIQKATSAEEISMEEKAPLGLIFTPHLSRTYPEKDLAANIIGFVSREDLKGHGGVEEKFENLLAGTPKTVLVPLDPNLVEQRPTVPDGTSLILTIDREIQASVEAILDKALKETGAESATIGVMDPKTGEILALATTPRLDLNEYWRLADIFVGDTPFNRAVSQTYEPGSVFKVFTMATGLDLGVVKPDTVFIDTGIFEYHGGYIRNWNGGAWGPQTMIGCMQHSLNVCLAWLGTTIGPSRFYEYMKAFGFGRPTGIELALEARGRLKLPGDDDWYPVDLATNSFGQGVAVTPVQMLMAASAIANGGNMMTPRIVRAVIDGGRQYDYPPQVAGRPISKETADTLAEMLAVSLEEESSVALVPGYRVSGKTGTAEIPTEYGYTSGETNASFVGWGPTDDPRFLVYVWLEKPEAAIWGSVVAAPVFSEVVQRLVVLMNIPPDEVRLSLNKQASQ